MLRTLVLVGFLIAGLLTVLGAWYLAHPEFWNWRPLANTEPDTTGPPEQANVTVAALGAPAAQTPASSIAPQSGVQAPAQIRRMMQEYVNPPTCALPPTVNITRSAGTTIYSWRNESGTLVISTTPPDVQNSQVRISQYEGAKEYFTLNIESRGPDFSASLENQVTAEAKGIYRVLALLIGEENLRKVDLNIVLYPDAETYLEYANNINNRDMRSTAGFYSPGINEAVTYKQSTQAATLATIRHESTHLIATGSLGYMPRWLNEGLAQYFEQLKIRAQYVQIDLHQNSLALSRDAARSGYTLRLRDFLSSRDEDWRGANQGRNYALAESLVFFLLRNAQDRRAMSGLLKEIAANYCSEIDVLAVLQNAYPGGISRLEKDFHAWLMDDRLKPPHVF